MLRSRPGSVLPPRGGNGPKVPPPPPTGPSFTQGHCLCTQGITTPNSGLNFGSLPLGSLFQHFPACSFTHAAAACTHGSKTFTSDSAGKEDKEFHFTGEETETSREGVFCRKFRAERGLGRGCPYSAACFLHKTPLSSALQMWVEIFPKRGEFVSDLPLFQLYLWSLVPI